MKRIIIALSALALIALLTVLVISAPVQAKCHGKKSQMNMESMEGMDHAPGMCCSMDHQMATAEKEKKENHENAPMDHSKMEGSSLESNSEVDMAGMEKGQKTGSKAKSNQEASPKKVKDPVCGMEVDPKSAAAKATYKDKTYYFCSVAEKEQFEKAPEKYVK
jgi:YHS domain-containing protein